MTKDELSQLLIEKKPFRLCCWVQPDVQIGIRQSQATVDKSVHSEKRCRKTTAVCIGHPAKWPPTTYSNSMTPQVYRSIEKSDCICENAIGKLFLVQVRHL
jgi:hypothetical protein